ncbi:hypothetical protein ACFU8W_34745 [Streptomyces sp. NPDC057565]|uniref:hypothetical protein n=1 Tax=Streptomyces sp. NPDC057565 TaxID=3346169 RepID=UPI003684D144
MRAVRSLTTAALVLALASTAVACGGDGGTGQDDGHAAASGAPQGATADPGADGNGKTAVAGLGKVADMNGVAELVKSATECDGFNHDNENMFADIDGDYVEDDSALAAQITATNKAFSIKDRASCSGESAIDNVHKMMLIDDMATFEAAYKKYQRSDGDTHTRYFVGQNFAVQLNGRSSEEEALVRAGTLGINCSPNFVPPAGFRSEPAQVDGCVLTDYVG